MKYFVFSDIHGCASALKRALADAGFDRDNPDHTAISCGDCFDRGEENREVMKFLEGLPRAVLVRGNHEDLLEDALMRGYLTFVDYMNGTDITVREFFGKRSLYDDGFFRQDRFISDPLRKFINSTVNYFETERYVFVHGWLPVWSRKDLDPNIWRKASERAWKKARFLQWQECYPSGLILPHKTIVCGHRSACFGARFDPCRPRDLYEPFFGNRVIAIDGSTVVSGKVNVIVLEDREVNIKPDLF